MKRFFALLRLHILRDVAHHWLLSLLSLAGIALGVAVYVTVSVANHSAKKAFEAGIDLVAGRARLEVRSAAGSLDEKLYPVIARHPAVAHATPIVEGYGIPKTRPGTAVQILGVDVFSNAPFSVFALQEREDGLRDAELGEWMGRPRQVFVSEAGAEWLGVKTGDALEVTIAGQKQTLRVAGVAPFEGATETGGARVLLMDIGWAQELLGVQGRLSRVLLRPREDMSVAEVQRALSEHLPASVLISRPSQRNEQVDRMLSGFQLNLQAMSQVSLLVGAFLIYNTLSASVVRRRRQIGTLRALGASRRDIRNLYLAESVLYAVPGVVLGLMLGLVLGGSLLGTVEQTIGNLYVRASIERLYIPYGQMSLAAAFGILTALVGAWLPAREASRTTPVEALHVGHLQAKTFRDSGAFAVAGVLFALCAFAIGWLAISIGPPWLGFGSAFCVLAAGACGVPGAARLLCAGLERVLVLASKLTPVRIGTLGFAQSLHRTAVTVAALLCAVALSAGVAIMIHSFRETVRVWVDQVMRADIYVTALAESASSSERRAVHPELHAWLKGQPEVQSLDSYRSRIVEINGEPMTLAGVDGEAIKDAILGGHAEGKLRTWRTEPAVMISESASRRLNLRPGDSLAIPADAGLVELRVAGIYRDFTSDRGVLLVWLEQFLPHWHEPQAHSIGVYLKPSADAEAFVERIQQRSSAWEGAAALLNRDLRKRVFEVFDQTFAVTNVLQIVAVIVAVAGVLLSLTVVVLEKAKELAVLRSLGASRGQISTIVLSEAGLIGVLASIGGLVAGYFLAIVLTQVINKAFFGWSITIFMPWQFLMLTPVWVIFVSLLAGVWPARRATLINLTEALRYE